MVVQGGVGYLLVVHRLKKVENHWSSIYGIPVKKPDMAKSFIQFLVGIVYL